MPEIPVLRYACKHVDSKKVVNREYSYGGVITSIDLCQECANDPDFLEFNSSYRDTKITKQPKKRPLTIAQLEKEIKKRKDEIKAFDKEISSIWHESDKIDRIGKLLERYMLICQLYRDLGSLNENYITKIHSHPI